MKLCSWWQLAADLTNGSPSRLARLASAHRAKCPACAQAWRENQRIAYQLTTASHPATPGAPARLAARVAAGIALAERNGPPRPSRFRFGPAMASVAAIVALVLGVTAWQRGSRPPADSSPLFSHATLAEVRTRLPLPNPDRLQALNDAVELPLRTEIEAMKADVRTVTEYLSRNLLPKDLLAADQW